MYSNGGAERKYTVPAINARTDAEAEEWQKENMPKRRKKTDRKKKAVKKHQSDKKSANNPKKTFI